MSLWIVYVILTTLLTMVNGDLLGAMGLALFLMFIFWPMAFLVDIIIYFVEAIIEDLRR